MESIKYLTCEKIECGRGSEEKQEVVKDFTKLVNDPMAIVKVHNLRILREFRYDIFSLGKKDIKIYHTIQWWFYEELYYRNSVYSIYDIRYSDDQEGLDCAIREIERLYFLYGKYKHHRLKYWGDKLRNPFIKK